MRIIIYAAILYAILYALRGIFGSINKQVNRDERGDGSGGDVAADDEMIVCPECGTYFPSGIGIPRRVGRERHSFCGEECAQGYSLRGGPPEEAGP